MEMTLETTLKRSNPLAMMQELLRRTAITHSETAHCEKHGEYTADVSADGRKSPCPLCQAEAKAAEQAEQAERENRRLTEKLGRCGIPKRHQGCRVNTYRAETAKQQALKTAVTEYVREISAWRRFGSPRRYCSPLPAKSSAACRLPTNPTRKPNGA